MENNKQTEVQKQNQQVQKDNTPKWKIRLLYLFAIGACSPIFASLIGLIGDAPGKCIKNNNYTRNYVKQLDADFADMVRRNKYYRNLYNE